MWSRSSIKRQLNFPKGSGEIKDCKKSEIGKCREQIKGTRKIFKRS